MINTQNNSQKHIKLIVRQAEKHLLEVLSHIAFAGA